MKKAMVFLLGLCLLSTSCRQPIPAPTGTEIPVTLVAESPATRTYIQETADAWVPYWRTGDSLTVILSYEMSFQKTFVNQDPDGRTGHFTGSLPIAEGLHSLIAYYPKGMKNGRAEQVFKFKLSEGFPYRSSGYSQFLSDGNFLKLLMILVLAIENIFSDPVEHATSK